MMKSLLTEKLEETIKELEKNPSIIKEMNELSINHLKEQLKELREPKNKNVSRNVK